MPLDSVLASSLIVAYAQQADIANLPKFGGMEKVQKGVCQSMSMYWIKQKLGEIESGAKHSATATVAGIRDRFFDIAEVQLDGENAGTFAIYKAGEAAWGLKKEGAGLIDIGVSAFNLDSGRVQEEVTKTKKGCFLFSFDCFDGVGENIGGHAIAFYLSGGKGFGYGQHVYIFDPNYGEFKVPKSNFKNWLERLLEKEYGRSSDKRARTELYKYSDA